MKGKNFRMKKVGDKYYATFTNGRHWFKWILRWKPKNVVIETTTTVSAPEEPEEEIIPEDLDE